MPPGVVRSIHVEEIVREGPQECPRGGPGESAHSTHAAPAPAPGTTVPPDPDGMGLSGHRTWRHDSDSAREESPLSAGAVAPENSPIVTMAHHNITHNRII